MEHPDILGSDEPQQSAKRGRPPKPKELDWDALSEPEKVLHTYNDGKGDASVCKALEISKEEFDDRLKEDGVFQKLISYGRTIAKAWWEERYQLAATGEGAKMNASMINFWMKNVYGWAEKSETTNSDILNIEGLTRDEVTQKIRDLGPNIIDIIQMKNKKG